MSATFTERRVIVIAATDKDKANAALDAKGFGPENFFVPLADSVDTKDAVKFYGTNWQMRPDQWPVIQSALNKAGVSFNATLLDHYKPNRASVSFEDVAASSARKVVYSDKVEIAAKK